MMHWAKALSAWRPWRDATACQSTPAALETPFAKGGPDSGSVASSTDLPPANAAAESPPARPLAPLGDWFALGDVEEVRRTYYEQGPVEGGPWDRLRHAHLVLPEWFESGLDPWGQAYAVQQERLWAAIVGVDRPYDAAIDEQEAAWGDIDPIRRPGFFNRRDAQAVASAADHLLACGMLVKHSGLQPGQHALEYGPGFGHTALTLARLGVQVDTVDISAVFCNFIRRQAEHFQVPLTAHQAAFGTQPVAGRRYKLIWFYESFHHCVDFMRVVPQLEALLDDGGRVILIGEPIVEKEYAAVPYPWGVRLHSEVAAVMRQTRWFELGFSEAFLYELFRRSGLRGRRIDCEPSPFGRLYLFERA